MSALLTPTGYINVGRSFLALAGLTIALMGSSLNFDSLTVSSNELVLVNQRPISLKQLNFAAQRLTGASADTLDHEQKHTIVKLLIDEELLIQRAESLGIASVDPGIRKALARTVINQTTQEFLDNPISEQQLQNYYLSHQSLFTQPLRIKLKAYKFDRLAKASQAFEFDPQLANQPSVLPSSALPVHMVRRYLGNKLTNIALNLEAGQTSSPISQPDGVYLLTLIDRHPEQTPPFTQVRSQIEAEYKRRGRDTALQLKLATLRRQAVIEINHEQHIKTYYE